MKLVHKNIWEDFDQLDYVCITTNAVSKSNGNLVMGKGIAKQADIKNPKLKVEFGKQLRDRGLFNKFYGLLLAEEKYIAFQTKYHWLDNSPLELVSRTTVLLCRLAHKYPDKTFGLPFPAINNGGRDYKEILPLLQELPDNVFVYYKEVLNDR